MNKMEIMKSREELLRERVLTLPLAEFCSLAFMMRALDADHHRRQALKLLAGRVQNLLAENPGITVNDFLTKIDKEPGLLARFGKPQTAMRTELLKLLGKFGIRTLAQDMQEDTVLSRKAASILEELKKLTPSEDG